MERQNKHSPQVDEAVIADAPKCSTSTARGVIADLEDAEFMIMRRPRGDFGAICEAARTGNWFPVSDWDLKAWLAAVNAGFITKDAVTSKGGDAIAELTRTVLLTRELGTPALETGYAEALRLIREGRAWPGAITKALGGASADGPEGNVWQLYSERMHTMSSDAEPADEEPEKDTWGICERLANDMAAVHGCRVELSGCDDPHVPLTYDDDNLSTYAVVMECATGRLVGLVKCWQSEEGDLIVPRSWLATTLSAWTVEGTPRRAA